jgi:hypothetical protein
MARRQDRTLFEGTRRKRSTTENTIALTAEQIDAALRSVLKLPPSAKLAVRSLTRLDPHEQADTEHELAFEMRWSESTDDEETFQVELEES